MQYGPNLDVQVLQPDNISVNNPMYSEEAASLTKELEGESSESGILQSISTSVSHSGV